MSNISFDIYLYGIYPYTYNNLDLIVYLIQEYGNDSYYMNQIHKLLNQFKIETFQQFERFNVNHINILCEFTNIMEIGKYELLIHCMRIQYYEKVDYLLRRINTLSLCQFIGLYIVLVKLERYITNGKLLQLIEMIDSTCDGDLFSWKAVAYKCIRLFYHYRKGCHVEFLIMLDLYRLKKYYNLNSIKFDNIYISDNDRDALDSYMCEYGRNVLLQKSIKSKMYEIKKKTKYVCLSHWVTYDCQYDINSMHTMVLSLNRYYDDGYKLQYDYRPYTIIADVVLDEDMSYYDTDYDLDDKKIVIDHQYYIIVLRFK